MKIDSPVKALEEALHADLFRLANKQGEGRGTLFSHRHAEGVHIFGCSYELAAPLTEYREVMLRVGVTSWEGDSITGDVIWVRSRAEYPFVEERVSVSGISDASIAEFRKAWGGLCEDFETGLVRRAPRPKNGAETEHRRATRDARG